MSSAGTPGNSLTLNGSTLAIEDGVSGGGTSPTGVKATFTTFRQINLNGGGTLDVKTRMTRP